MFSPEELTFVSDATLFPRKEALLQRVEGAFAGLRDALREEAYTWPLPPGTDVRTGKISRGERYHGQPWRMLDFPRLFGRDGVLAARTLFRWGDPVGFHLHLSGIRLDACRDRVTANWPSAAGAGWMASWTGDPWDYRFADPDHRGAGPLPLPPDAASLRVRVSLPLHEAGRLVERGRAAYAAFFGLMAWW